MPSHELPGSALPELSALWRSEFPDCPPIGTVLHRYNTVLTELFAGQEVYVTTVTYVMDEGFTNPTPTGSPNTHPAADLTAPSNAERVKYGQARTTPR
ncbi:hypothetical protein B0I32_108322 [Nonomuraea fuscirosea]|uniref:DUF3885 domain-containing protein n=1 Tax=Nonomuraea fuscirosea TaxID=1291556 RepID=A0A2T0N014_9ACTN|nr:hypothetical protein [Nonomuraea fuscirosea]PRX64957.1 hypothetical protein B0I32_108322 [Nonomuraea fuscirosea]